MTLHGTESNEINQWLRILFLPLDVGPILDLQNDREYGSAIVGYGTDEELVLFDEAVIQRVTGGP